jgi:hypothetical protein
VSKLLTLLKQLDESVHANEADGRCGGVGVLSALGGAVPMSGFPFARPFSLHDFGELTGLRGLA